MARRCDNLQDYLRTRKVYRTPWQGIFEVLDTKGIVRHRVVLTGPASAICSCRRGQFDKECRHQVLVIMRKGGPNGRGIRIDTDNRRGAGGHPAQRDGAEEATRPAVQGRTGG